MKRIGSKDFERYVMSTRLRILALDDDDCDVRRMLAILGEGGFHSECVRAVTAEQFKSSLAAHNYDVIIAECRSSVMCPDEVLRISHEYDPTIPVIFASLPIGDEAAVELLKSGASDFVIKPDCSRLAAAVSRTLRERAEARAAAVDADRYRDLVEHSHELICTHDLEGHILSFNQGAARLLGYEKSDFVDQKISDLLAPEVRDGFDAYLQEVRKKGVARGLMLVQGRNGERRIWEYNNTLRTEGVEQPIVRGMAYDITERKRAERALRRNNQLVQLLQAVAEAANQAVIVDDAIQTALDGICGYSKWPLGHVFVVAGDSTGDLVPTNLWHLEDAGRFEAIRTATEASRFAPDFGLVGQVMATGRFAWIPDVTKDADCVRSKLIVEAGLKAAFAFPVVAGTEVVAVMEFFSKKAGPADPTLVDIMGYVGVQLGRVIERERSNKALRDAEGRYRDLFENAHDIMYTHDLQGNVTSANKKAQQLLGYSAFELASMNVAQIVAPECLETVHGHLADKVSGETESTTYEATVITRAGRRIPLEVGSRLIYKNGQPIGVQGIGRDISERKHAEEEHRRLEEQLIHAQKMESIGRLAGGVAHDFNNLLTAIIGYSQLSLGRLDVNNPMCQEIEEIIKAGRRAAALTEQLLAFSRRQKMEPRYINLNDTIADLTKMLRRLIGADVDVLVQFDPNLPSVFADPFHVEQVLMNLAVNARDAMPLGGRLQIETHHMTLDQEYCQAHPWARPGKFAEIRVSDQGEGMSSETLSHIFEPFYTTKQTGKGTGLGLAVVYGIIQQHDGLICVSSEPDRGTTFRVLLPAKEIAAEDKAGTVDLPLRGGTETILVAEDETALQKLSVQLLADLGYTVLLASDGEEALLMYENRGAEIDLLLLDLVMPRMSGRQVYEVIRSRGGRTPAIFVSGYAPEEMKANFGENFGAPLIQKPFSISDLGRKVREVLDLANGSRSSHER